MKKLLKLLSFLTIILLLSSCSDDDDPIIPVSNTIVDVAVNNNLSSLVAAVVRADLAGTLSGPGPFTVFAPTNEAFQELLDSNPDWSSVDDIPVETLTNVLLFHVLSGEVRSGDLTDTSVNTLATGTDGEPLSLQIEVTGGIKFNGDAEPVIVDVDASNGVVHVIDKVMLPRMDESNTIVDVAVNNELTSLVAAVTRADLADTLSGDGPFTVFAPTNEAFQELLDSNADWNSVDDIPVETLQTVLLFHVLSGEVRAGDLSDTYVNTSATGANGETLKLKIEVTGGVKFNGDAAPVIVDVEASNGVVHVIDKVMLPSNTIVDLAINNDLTSLVAAVTRADLADTLSGDGPFTVFAPTNDAFQALLDSNADWNSVDDIPVETLQAVLLFHVLSGEVRSTDLSDTYVNTLSTGPNDEALSLQVEVTGGIEFNGDAAPIANAIDFEASNGVVHVINKVMLPPNVVTLALNNAGFTSLVAALTDDRHTTNFVEVLTGDGPFTVFAPTNDAFQALLDSNTDWNSLGDIPIATLEAVLLYHVVALNVQSDELTNGDVTTLGGTITIDKDNLQINTTSGQDPANIIIADVQGTNGVVHAIDAVLLP